MSRPLSSHNVRRQLCPFVDDSCLVCFSFRQSLSKYISCHFAYFTHGENLTQRNPELSYALLHTNIENKYRDFGSEFRSAFNLQRK